MDANIRTAWEECDHTGERVKSALDQLLEQETEITLKHLGRILRTSESFPNKVKSKV